MTAFTDYVNLELPKRIVLFTEGNTGYTGDPNLAVNAVINNAPQGTQFIDNTGPSYQLYVKQQQAVSTSWVLAGTAGGASGSLDVYISSAGNDSNDGLGAGTPVATWTKAWSIAGAGNVVVHISGNPGTYVRPPDNVAKLVLTGDDNFTTVVTGAAGASTSSVQLELAVATTLHNYRHYTLEFTDGAAVGYRRQIRSNTTTIVTPVQAFESHSAPVSPAPGDTYVIKRPSAVVALPASYAVPGSKPGLTSFADLDTAVSLVNVSVTGTGGTVVNANPNMLIYGAEFASNVQLSCRYPGRVTLGSTDEKAFIEFKELEATLGLTLADGAWHGWGLSFTGAFSGSVANFGGFFSGSNDLDTKDLGSMYGFVTGDFLFPQCYAQFLGGSCATLQSGRAAIQISLRALANPESFANPTVPFFIYDNSGQPALGSFAPEGPIVVQYTFGNNNVGIQLESVRPVHNFGLVMAGNGGVVEMSARLEITSTGTGRAVRAYNAGTVILQSDNWGTVVPWNLPDVTAFNVENQGRIAANLAQTVVCRKGFDVLGGGILEFVGDTVLSCSQDLGTIVGGRASMSGVAFQATPTLTATCNAPVALALSRLATFTHEGNGTCSITNTATGANTVIACSGGSTVSLGNPILDGTAGASGYGIDARGGGRVFISAAPSSVQGVTADLAIGTAGGEEQPNSFLSGSFSALVSANTVSSISRSS